MTSSSNIVNIVTHSKTHAHQEQYNQTVIYMQTLSLLEGDALRVTLNQVVLSTVCEGPQVFLVKQRWTASIRLMSLSR